MESIKRRFTVMKQAIAPAAVNEDSDEDDDPQTIIQRQQAEEQATKVIKRLEKQRALISKLKKDSLSPRGVLAIHIREVKFVDLDIYKNFTRKDISVYFRVTCQGKVRLTDACDDIKPPCVVNFDALKHFTLAVSDKRSSESNILKIEIMCFDPSQHPPRTHKVIAVKSIHLYSIVKVLYAIETYEFRNQSLKLSALMETELCFSYGEFGYGFANQFQSHAISDKMALKHSNFLRMEPPYQRRNYTFDVITAAHVGTPTYLPFNREADMAGMLDELDGDLHKQIKKLHTKLNPSLTMSRIRTSIARKQSLLDLKPNRVERIKFIREYLNGYAGTTEKMQLIEDVNFTIKRRRLDSNSEGAGAMETNEDEDEDDANDADANKMKLSTMANLLTFAPGIKMGGARHSRAYSIPMDLESDSGGEQSDGEDKISETEETPTPNLFQRIKMFLFRPRD